MATTSVPVPSAGGALLPSQAAQAFQFPTYVFRQLTRPGAGTYPVVTVTDCGATSGTISAGGGANVNVLIWTGTLWTVLKNVT